jgi:xanthine/uracil permease
MIPYIISLALLIVTLVAHLVGLDSLYYKIPQYDIFMHILGGVGIGFFVYGLMQTFHIRLHNKFTTVVLGTLALAFVWELIEIYYNIAGYPLWTKPYYIDTVKDLIDGCIGGTVAFLFARKLK